MNRVELLKSYCQKRWKIIPLKNGTKEPAISNWKNLATDNFETIMRWEKQFDKPGWGLYAEGSGLIIVDTDLKHDGPNEFKKLTKEMGDISTLTSNTGGGGNHYIYAFKNKKGKIKGFITKGIDIKFNGYIVLPPSIHPNGNFYEWQNFDLEVRELPDSLYKYMVSEVVDTVQVGSKKIPIPKSISYQIVELVKKSEIQYSEWINTGMALKHSYPDEFGRELFLDATENLSYQEGDLEKANEIWDSIKNDTDSPFTMRGLLYLLEKKGHDVSSIRAKIDFSTDEEIPENYSNIKGSIYRNGQLIFENKALFIKYINSLGYFYLKNCSGASFGKITIDKNKVSLVLFKETKLKELLAPIKVEVLNKQGEKVLKDAHLIWISNMHRKEYDNIIFSPTEENERSYNMYRPLRIAEGNGSCDLILNMIFESLCGSNNVHFEFVIKFLAHIVQFPNVKPFTILVFYGIGGTGKGLLFDVIMRKILNEYYVKLVDSKALSSRFNEELAYRLLVNIDEASAVQSRDSLSTLKSFSGSDKLTVEYKFGGRIEVDSYNRYVICTNESKAIGLEKGNRRFVIIRSSEKYANDKEYFGPIFKEFKNGLIENFYSYLKNLDLSNFDPNVLPQITEDDLDAQLSANGPVFSFWHDLLFISPQEISDGESISKNKVYDLYKYSNFSQKYDFKTPQEFWSDTKRFIPLIAKFKDQDKIYKGHRSRFIPVSVEILQKDFSDRYKISLQNDVSELDFLITEAKSTEFGEVEK